MDAARSFRDAVLCGCSNARLSVSSCVAHRPTTGQLLEIIGARRSRPSVRCESSLLQVAHALERRRRRYASVARLWCRQSRRRASRRGATHRGVSWRTWSRHMLMATVPELRTGRASADVYRRSPTSTTQWTRDHPAAAPKRIAAICLRETVGIVRPRQSWAQRGDRHESRADMPRPNRLARSKCRTLHRAARLPPALRRTLWIQHHSGMSALDRCRQARATQSPSRLATTLAATRR